MDPASNRTTLPPQVVTRELTIIGCLVNFSDGKRSAVAFMLPVSQALQLRHELKSFPGYDEGSHDRPLKMNHGQVDVSTCGAPIDPAVIAAGEKSCQVKEVQVSLSGKRLVVLKGDRSTFINLSFQPTQQFRDALF